jgi:hypothetical protein
VIKGKVTRLGDFFCKTFTLGSFLITKVANILGYFFHGQGYALILTKVLGYILGDFFTNTSGLPDQM